MNPVYLWVDLAVLLPTLALSFDKRVGFYKQWRWYWPVNALVLAVFVAWDVVFTERGIWGFNPEYLVGVDLLGLPIEEWGFFIAVPYACTFTYATLKHYLGARPGWRGGTASVNLVVLAVSGWLVASHWDHAYTAAAAGGLFVLMALLMLQPRPWLGWFWVAYLVLLVPFVVSNGVLTGLTFWDYPLLHQAPERIADHIVWYNNAENTGVRLLAMPVDDLVYGALLMLLHVAGLEFLMRRRRRISP